MAKNLDNGNKRNKCQNANVMFLDLIRWEKKYNTTNFRMFILINL